MENSMLLQPYEKFGSTVEGIRSGALQVERLGIGSESEVFKVDVDSVPYAVKFAVRYTRLDRPRNTVRVTQRKIDAGLRGLGIDGLEQIVSASTTSGVAVYDLVPGKTVKSMTEADISKVTKKQMMAFMESVDEAVELGIEFDPWNQDGSNVLYSPEVGFTLIDYFVDYAETTKDQNRENGYKALGSSAVGLFELIEIGLR